MSDSPPEEIVFVISEDEKPMVACAWWEGEMGAGESDTGEERGCVNLEGEVGEVGVCGEWPSIFLLFEGTTVD